MHSTFLKSVYGQFKSRLTCVAVSLVALPGVCCATVSIDDSLPSEVIARVNGEPIPRRWVEIFLKNDREALALDPATDAGRQALAELPAHILDELVDRYLIGQGARERNVAATDGDLAAAEGEMISFCGNDARYEAYVAQNGFSRAEYRDVVLRTKLNGKAMIATLTKDIALPDTEVGAYYEAHQADADFQWPDRVTGSHILFNTQPPVLSHFLERRDGITPNTAGMEKAVAEETDRRRRLAETVREKALSPGGDFAALAKEYSEDTGTRDGGGSLGTFARGVHLAALDDAFFKLKAGEVGPVVHSDLGYHVIRTDVRSPAGRRTRQECAPEIRRRLLQARAAQVMKDWLTNARASAKIVLREAGALPRQ